MFFGYVTKGRACPRCKSADVHRIRRHGMALRAVCNVMNVRPYWCADCDNFFLAPKQEKRIRIEGQYGVSGGERSSKGRPEVNDLPH
jgi:hypothetical protein